MRRWTWVGVGCEWKGWDPGVVGDEGEHTYFAFELDFLFILGHVQI